MKQLQNDTAPTLSLDCMMRRKPFFGSVREDSFKLSSLQKILNNSWAPVAVGQITSMGERTRIELKFRINTAVTIFMFVWMGLAITGCIAAVMSGATSGVFFVPLLLPIFGVVLCAAGAVLGRGEQRTLLRYFSELPESQLMEERRF